MRDTGFLAGEEIAALHGGGNGGAGLVGGGVGGGAGGGEGRVDRGGEILGNDDFRFWIVAGRRGDAWERREDFEGETGGAGI
jgi:hypothetical protein